MQKTWAVVLVVALPGGTRVKDAPRHHSYLFMWAGDSAQKSSDFLAVIDADPASPQYGRVLASVPTGEVGTPHHTEAELAPDGHLLANDFTLGRTWLFDVNHALHPRVIASFGDVAGFSHPHTFTRLADGSLLTTFQYRATTSRGAQPSTAGMRGMPEMKIGAAGGPHSTGGLVEMDERGNAIRARSAVDPAVHDTLLYPYSALPIRALARVVSTTTDMNLADSSASSRWIQIWRLSDLKLLRSIELPPGPRGNENKYTGESRLLPDGRSVYIHTFNCGIYLLRDVATRPTVKFVHGFEGTDCGVPVLTSHYWLQTVPAAHALVAMDIRDPEHPREVSRVAVGASEYPHWVAIDPTGRRVVLNSGGHGSRLFIINFDPATGALAVDQGFRDAGSNVAGVSMDGRKWPHGFTGNAVPHGSVFSR